MSIDKAQQLQEGFLELTEKIRKGIYLTHLKEIFDGSIAAGAISELLDRFARPGNPERDEMVAEIERLRKELRAGSLEFSAPLENILVDRILVLWLDCYLLDRRFLANEHNFVTLTDATETIASYEHRRETYQRKLNQAIKTLASVREKMKELTNRAWPGSIFNARLGNLRN
jgi:hypothetical protein